MSSKMQITYITKNPPKNPLVKYPQETPLEELSKFIHRYANNYTYDMDQSTLDVIFILRKLSVTHVIKLNSDTYNDLYSIASKGLFKFISILLSDEKIKIEDNGKLLLCVFDFPSYKYIPNVNDLQEELIILLLKQNSNYYSDDLLVLRYIFHKNIYLQTFIPQLQTPINNKVFTMLSLNGLHIDKINSEQLTDLDTVTLYDIISGSMLCVRDTIFDGTKEHMLLKAYGIIDFIFDRYIIQDIPIDVIIKCFHPHDTIQPNRIISNYEGEIYRNYVSKLISKIEILSKKYDSKIFDLYSILVNFGFYNCARDIIKSIPIITINKYFIRSIRHNSKSIVTKELLETYPDIYCTSADIYSNINNSIDNVHKIILEKTTTKSYETFSMIHGRLSSTDIIDKMLSRIDKPIGIIPLNIINNLITAKWYSAIASLSKQNDYRIRVICTNVNKIPSIDLITGGIHTQPDNYTNRFIFMNNGKEIVIDFVDTNIYMIIPILFQTHNLPTDISNYVNSIASQI